MADKLSVYNSALRLLGEERLDTLTDPVKARRTLDDVYLDGIYFCLEQSYWNFATRAIEANSVPSITPTFGYKFAFTKPDDWLRTAAVWSDANEKNPLTEYAFEQGYFWANIDPIYVRYVSNDNQYGMDLGKWTKSFQLFVEAHLAAEIAPVIKESKHEEMLKLVKARLGVAANRDVMDEPARFPPMGSWARSRLSPSGRSSFRGTGRGL